VNELNARSALSEACEEREVNEESVLSEVNAENGESAVKEVNAESALSEANVRNELSEENEESDLNGLSELSEANGVSVECKEKTSNVLIETSVAKDWLRVKKLNLKHGINGLKAEVKVWLLLWNSKLRLVIRASTT